jgi:uncharacterized protein (TIGR02597 family)
MEKKASAILVVALLALAAQSAQAECKYLGINAVNVPAQSDVLVSVPHSSVSLEGTLTVSSVSGSDVQVTGATFDDDEYNDLYYVRFTSGAASGKWATITDTASGTLTLAEDAAAMGVAANDTLEVFKHATLASVFPDNLEGITFKASQSAFNRSTEIKLYGDSVKDSEQNNKAPNLTYYFYNDAWRKAPGLVGDNYDNVILEPEAFFVIRNKSNDAIKFVTFGCISSISPSIELSTTLNNNDVLVSTGLAVPVTLEELNLGGTPAFRDTQLTFNRPDELRLFNNATAGQNKAPGHKIYYYKDGHWRLTPGDANYIADDDVIPAGSAIVIRRKPDSTPETVTWTIPSPLD